MIKILTFKKLLKKKEILKIRRRVIKANRTHQVPPIAIIEKFITT